MKKKKFMLVALFTMFLAGGLFAQPGHGGDGGGDFGQNPAPIDGGIIALVVAGAAYGVKRNVKK